MTPSKFSDAEGMQDLGQALARWQLVADGVRFRTATSLLQRVFRQGEPAFLKIALCEEERRGAAVLRWWNGEGAVRVWALHKNAVLLECACGSQSLVEMSQNGRDVEASRIICATVARLHAYSDSRLHGPMPELVPLLHWFSALFSAAALREGFFRELAAIAHELLAAPQDVVVLHGDVHHGNILDADRRGWLAIDPKGLLGERGFDFANLFCNPDQPTAAHPKRFEQRVDIVVEEAGLERTRLLAWIAAWAGLSAAWHVEDGETPDTALAIAALALRALPG